MKDKKTKLPPYDPYQDDGYDDDDIPQIDLPKKDVDPDEVPRRDGPGGE